MALPFSMQSSIHVTALVIKDDRDAVASADYGFTRNWTAAGKQYYAVYKRSTTPGVWNFLRTISGENHAEIVIQLTMLYGITNIKELFPSIQSTYDIWDCYNH